ncbi:MAG: transketolase family protein, partial [Candidatus Nucleicultricaceae bacterium]
GPLGQGFANAVGMALAEKILRARFKSSLVDHYTYAVVGDGCLMEGISQEAISFAGHHQLNKLIVLFDDNHISIDGPTSLSTTDDTLMRFRASNWHVLSVDGHDMVAITKALEEAHASKDRPTLIACRTTIGYGAPTKSGTAAVHGSPLGAEEVRLAREFLKWDHPPFEIPAALLEEWRTFGQRGAFDHTAWQERFHACDSEIRQSFLQQFEALRPEDVVSVTSKIIQQFKQDLLETATRQSSGMVLDALALHFPQLIGGSADLTGSNNTKAKSSKPMTPEDSSGNYIYYGVREHAMGAIMNGLCLHGGFRPFGGTFLVFSDYCRPAIRLSALMHQPVIYVMTHDSIGLGEDGPTHQPIEHLASLRAMPNLQVFRPADAVEVAECWEIALLNKKSPSLLALTRQKLPLIRHEQTSENLSKRGGYVLQHHDKPRVILLATGSEVSLALNVAAALHEKQIASRVVSMPSTTLFDQQEQAYKDDVLGKTLEGPVLRVSIEAATPYGWERYVGQEGLAIGIDHFGASAPFEEIYKRFGLDVESITAKILNTLKG